MANRQTGYLTGLEEAGVAPITKTRADMAALRGFLAGQPDSSGGAATPSPVVGDDSTGSGISAVDKIMSGEGLSSPLDAEAIAAEQERARLLRREQADSIFGPRIQRAEDLGKAQVSTAEGAAGVSQQFNLSTARLSLLNNLGNRIDDRIGAIEKEKQVYIDTGDFQGQQRADKQLTELREYQNDILFKQADYALGIEERDYARGRDVIEDVREDKLLEFNLGAEDRAISAEERQVAQQEKEAVQQLAAEFSAAGIELDESLSSALAKASPFLEEGRKLGLEKLQAEVAAINRSNRPSGGGGDGAIDGDRFLEQYLAQAEDGTWVVNPNAILESGFTTIKAEETNRLAQELANNKNKEEGELVDTGEEGQGEPSTGILNTPGIGKFILPSLADRVEGISPTRLVEPAMKAVDKFLFGN